MSEKRVLLAAFLSILVISLYSQAIARRYPLSNSPRELVQRQAVLPNRTEYTEKPAASQLQRLEQEDIMTIESNELGLEIGKSSGSIRTVTLKGFMDEFGTNPLKISSPYPISRIQFGDSPLTWKVIEEARDHASFEASDNSGNNYHILYEIDSANSILKLVLNQISGSVNGRDLVLISSWARGDGMDRRRNQLEMLVLYNNGKNKPSYKRYLATSHDEKIVPRGTILASLAERYFCQSIRSGSGSFSVKLISSPEESIVTESLVQLSELPGNRYGASVSIYFGPRDYFHLEKAGFKEAFPVGTLGQIGLSLLFVLSIIARITKNYGIAIILFSGFITCMMAPFTMLSFKSMKKMQELKPQIDRIMAQHKNDSTKANQEIFSLYKQHRISPLSSCLPMLLQMPIFISLVQAISHFIELRGKQFLWIKDLSLPDRLAHFPVSIPLLGSDLNVLPIVMATAMYVQTKISQGRMGQVQQDPTTRMFSGPMMSIMFGVMFYQFPSGLVLYWLTNSLVSLIFYRLVR